MNDMLRKRSNTVSQTELENRLNNVISIFRYVCLLSAVCWLLASVCCLLAAGCWLLSAVRCLL
jgi:hypothetical protein